jgi:tetratricopeptide (TPR) repeat protein
MLKRLFAAWRRADPAAVQRAHDLFDAGEHAAALAAYDALAERIDDPRQLVNAGYAALMLGDLDGAHGRFARAQVLAPQLAQAWIGGGDVAARRQDHAGAVACYDRALALDATQAVARNNRSLSLTALGRLEDAWRDAESRYETPGADALYPHRLDLPPWDGRSACRLLVHWEQGLGDIIQHLRFLPGAAQRAGQCTFECPPPLLPVVQGMAGAVRLVAATERAPDTTGFDRRVGLLSLPHLLGHTARTLPAPPYLQAPVPRETLACAARAAPGLRLGLVWRASLFDTRRNAPLEVLLAQAARLLPTAQWVSLQKDPTADEAALLRAHGCVDAGAGFGDFGDTAIAIRSLDAVVTVDTSVAHLSGALDHPTLLLLNHGPAERWMLEGDTTPWYPSVRLLRRAPQEPQADWIARALAAVPLLVGWREATPEGGR